MRRLFASAVLIASLFGGVALGDLIVRVRDKSGKIIQSIPIAAGSSVDVAEGDSTSPPVPAAVRPTYAVVVKDRTTLTLADATTLGDPATEPTVEQTGVVWRVYDVADATDVRQPAATRTAVTSYLEQLKARSLTPPTLLVLDSGGAAAGQPIKARVMAAVALPSSAAAIQQTVNQALGGK